jgi:PPOX class probable F420-dependent enzyme
VARSGTFGSVVARYAAPVPDLDDVQSLAAGDHHLAVVSTSRADGTIQASVVNAGVLPHPVSGAKVLAFVTYGPVKLANLRARPHVTVTFRAGWRWLTVEGAAEIVGPDDPTDGIDDEGLRRLRRDIFTAAGGTHDDWDEYDRTMVEQRRAGVLITPTRIYGNG